MSGCAKWDCGPLRCRRTRSLALRRVRRRRRWGWRSRRLRGGSKQVPRRTWDNPPRFRRSLRYDLRPNRRDRQQRDDAGQPTDCPALSPALTGTNRQFVAPLNSTVRACPRRITKPSRLVTYPRGRLRTEPDNWRRLPLTIVTPTREKKPRPAMTGAFH
jgi:hypothetical protein